MIIETHNANGQLLGFSELVEMYGEDLGFSLTKVVKKVTKPVSKVAKIVAKPIVKAAVVVSKPVAKVAVAVAKPVAKAAVAVAKPVVRATVSTGGVIGRNAGNIAVAATVVPTGGLSLLAKKDVRQAVGKTAVGVGNFTAKNIVKPLAQSKAVRTATGQAIRSFVPGGSAALSAFNTFAPKAKAKAPPIKVPPVVSTDRQRSAAASIRSAFGARPTGPGAATPAIAEAKPFPILPVALGGASLLGVLMIMGSHKR